MVPFGHRGEINHLKTGSHEEPVFVSARQRGRRPGPEIPLSGLPATVPAPVQAGPPFKLPLIFPQSY